MALCAHRGGMPPSSTTIIAVSQQSLMELLLLLAALAAQVQSVLQSVSDQPRMTAQESLGTGASSSLI